MEFFNISEEDLNSGKYAPLTTVFMIVRSEKGYMLLQNQKSGYWELPAGEIKSGETFSACAMRKCEEQSGQNQLTGVKFVGLCKMTFEKNEHRPNPMPVYLALYTSVLQQELPFVQNDKIKGILWHTIGQDVSPFCSTSNALIQYYESMYVTH